MYKFPLSIPVGKNIEITQFFKSTELIDFYKSKGLNIQFHDAVDVTCGNSIETYGTPFVCPFPSAILRSINKADPENGLGGRIQVTYVDLIGNTLVLGGLHLSGCVEKETYKEGDILGYIGNYGYVLPEPTIATPFGGSHIHMSLVKNGVPIDPLTYFDPKNPYRAADTGIERDKFGFLWSIQQIKIAMRKLGFNV